jgi:hypothetical protein
MADPIKFLAKEYLSRDDLESAIKIKVGNSIYLNQDAGHSIEGTREELKKFNLSDETNIFGVKCIITDSPTLDIIANKIKPIKNIKLGKVKKNEKKKR